MFTSDDWFFVTFSDDRDFRVANAVVKLAGKSGELYASYATIGGMCWPTANDFTRRNRAAKSIKAMVECGFLKPTGKTFGNGVTHFILNITQNELNRTQTELTQSEYGPNSNGVTTELNPSADRTQSELQYRDLRIELRKEEEESKTLLLSENKRAKPQAAAPRAAKEKLTSEQLDHLRQLCRQIYDLREDPHKRTIAEVLQVGCDKFGYEGLVELIKCIRHDPLMSVSPEHRTLAYAYNTHQRVLEAGRAAFEAERIRRQQLDEKMAQESAQRAKEQEYLQSEEHKRAMEETRAFIDANLKTQKWFLDSQAENNVA